MSGGQVRELRLAWGLEKALEVEACCFLLSGFLFLPVHLLHDVCCVLVSDASMASVTGSHAGSSQVDARLSRVAHRPDRGRRDLAWGPSTVLNVNLAGERAAAEKGGGLGLAGFRLPKR